MNYGVEQNEDAGQLVRKSRRERAPAQSEKQARS